MAEKQTTQNLKSMTTEPQTSQSCFDSSTIFSTQDFGKFLRKESPSSSPFLTMDVPLGSSEETSAFKSKDAFSHLFSSDDWRMKLKPHSPVPATQNDVQLKDQLKDQMPSLSLGPHADIRFDQGMMLSRESSARTSAPLDPWLLDLPPIKTPWDTMYIMSQIQPVLPQPSAEEERSLIDEFHWWNEKGLDPHPRPQEEEPSRLDDFHPRWNEEGLDAKPSPKEKPSLPDDFDPWTGPSLDPQPSPKEEFSSLDDFHSWTKEGPDLSVLPDPYLRDEEPIAEPFAAPVQSSSDISGKKKSSDISGKKKSSDISGKMKGTTTPRRPKVVPSTKDYVEPMANDVLLGRGGMSNNHPGNKRYREAVKNFREQYVGIPKNNKDEKTKLSQTLVDRWRFLKKDAKGWYVVPNLVARGKVSQYLRDNDDPEKRAAKRQRYLEKCARER